MKHFKLITILFLLVHVSIFLWKNMATLKTSLPFRWNLYFLEFHWEHHVYSLMAFSLVVGLILGILAMFWPYQKVKATLKKEREAKSQSSPDVDSSPSSSTQ